MRPLPISIALTFLLLNTVCGQEPARGDRTQQSPDEVEQLDLQDVVSSDLPPQDTTSDPVEDETDLPTSPQQLPTYLKLISLTTAPEHGWARIETWRDERHFYAAEDYLADGRNDHQQQAADCFGTARPPSSDFLLHYGPDWTIDSPYPPVLLVHGANTTADQAWSVPGLDGYCGVPDCPESGLLQHLHTQQLRVFAITFPHKHGDNRYWAQQIASAIEIISFQTGAPRVDLVAWSKGGFAARLFVADITPLGEATSRYRDQVRRLILLGTPNGGLDYTFRHGILPSLGVYPACGGSTNAPSAHTHLTCFGLSYNHKELSIYATEAGDFFPGQRQMLARWDEVYPISPLTQDWHTTYHGTVGFVSTSLGIDHAIYRGSLVADLQRKETSPTLEVYLLCGGSQDLWLLFAETSGPSDGLLFEESCTISTGFGNLVDTRLEEGENHFSLGWSPTSMSQITSWLLAE